MVKVLVLGATGKQGGATARALLSSPQQHAVRAYVRDPSSPKAQALAAAGAELVEGGGWDADVAALDRALAGGVEAVFFPSSPSFTDPGAEVRGAANIVEAARRAGTVAHVVYSTVIGVPRWRELPGLDGSPFFTGNYWTSKGKFPLPPPPPPLFPLPLFPPSISTRGDRGDREERKKPKKPDEIGQVSG